MNRELKIGKQHIENTVRLRLLTTYGRTAIVNALLSPPLCIIAVVPGVTGTPEFQTGATVNGLIVEQILVGRRCVGVRVKQDATVTTLSDDSLLTRLIETTIDCFAKFVTSD